MKEVGHGGWVTGVMPRGRMQGAQYGWGNRGLGNMGLSNMGLSNRVVE